MGLLAALLPAPEGARHDGHPPSIPRPASRALRRVGTLDRAFTLGSRLFIAVLPLSLVAQQVTSRDTSMGSLLTSAFRLEGSGRAAAETRFAPSDDVGAGVGLFALVVLLFALRGFARGVQRLCVDLCRVRLQVATAVTYQLAWAA